MTAKPSGSDAGALAIAAAIPLASAVLAVVLARAEARRLPEAPEVLTTTAP